MYAAVALALSVGMFLGAGISIHQYGQPDPLPVPQLRAGDCYVTRDYEPWHKVPDGQILQVGRRLYLMVDRATRITKDKYHGNKPYEFETPITEADKQYQRIECPRSWQ